MIKSKHLLFAMLCISLTFWGCSKEKVTPTETTEQVKKDDALLTKILKQGFKRQDIVEHEDRYVVQGDIIFYKKEPAPRKTPDNGRIQQARSDYIVAPGYRNISVYLDEGSFSSIDLNGPLNDALNAFNAVGTEIQFSRVYSAGAADIVVVQDPLSLGICGQAGFPFSDGRPFDNVYISEYTLNYYGLTDPSQLTLLVAHELGHCIGFRHTNWQSRGESSAIHIPGTPASDGSSIMNGGTCGVYWGGFSYYDQVGMQVLYTTTPGGTDVLNPGEELLQNESLTSSDGRFTLIMQGDGNLVIYYYNTPLWASNTCCNANINRCAMQGDGNLVLYDVFWNAHWASNTSGYPGGYLIMQNDGNLVIYQNGVPRWASNTCCH
jgi:hypothetical protein